MLRSRTNCVLIILSLSGLVLSFSPGLLLSEQSAADQNQRQGLIPRVLRFERKGTQEGLTAENFKFSAETWESSDGITIFLTRVDCRSPKKAKGVLRQSMKNATRILEKNILRDRHRRSVGQRIVVSFGSAMMTQSRVILWTDRAMFYTLESSSFQHELLFEKRLPGT